MTTQVSLGGKPITGGMHVRGGTTNSFRRRLDHFQIDPANKFLVANGRHAIAKSVGMTWPDQDDPEYQQKETHIYTAFDHAKETGKFKDPDAGLRGVSIEREILALCPPVVDVAPSAKPNTPSPRQASTTAPPAERTYEEIAPAERAQMKRKEPARFNALRADWIERGKPAIKI